MTGLDRDQVLNLPGPILVLGASGFVGSNLFRSIASYRTDVYGSSRHPSPWRLSDIPNNQVRIVNLLVEYELEALLTEIKPKTIFNCVAHGAYSFQTDRDLTYATNFTFLVNLLEKCSTIGIHCLIQAGTSSEYGRQSAGPAESAASTPNSHYAVSKCAAASAIYYMGKERGVPCTNLCIYSAYGPFEDSSRLIPQLVIRASEGLLPNFVNADISRDFVYIDDVVEAFVLAASNLEPAFYGQSFNIGTGTCTTIGSLANLAKSVFEITEKPSFSMTNRDWDVVDWFANSQLAREVLGWNPRTELSTGLLLTKAWYDDLNTSERQAYAHSSKRNFDFRSHCSVSAIVACYNDAEAIPIMYKRLFDCLEKFSIDYEIIFVNDASPDESEEVIRRLSNDDHRIIGISHSRNFGSQAAFRSGMEMASKKSVVLLDGDLQDPPELIEQFIKKWREGFDVVYGRRVKREAPWYMQVSYKVFYRLFNSFSYLNIPRDAGDFSLLDSRVVNHMLKFPERDMFIRGLRAFVGFRQTGVDYVRPDRKFGDSTNSFLRNLAWAKKGIFSFSYKPLNVLTTFSFILFLCTVILSLYQVTSILLFPDSAPRGITTLLLVNLGFGAIILLAISLLGEYIARIFEEVKQRPRYIRRSILRDGEIRDL